MKCTGCDSLIDVVVGVLIIYTVYYYGDLWQQFFTAVIRCIEHLAT